tara:strand:- start:17132 stop:18466 length:1335 start_codon:yes stop_codon:yes gene_type:complete
MSANILIRLSVMMFFQFFIWGSWYVTAPNYLSGIGFQAEDFGWTYSVGPIAGMISPFFVGMIADRFFAAQRVLGVMHILGGLIMFGATRLMVVDSPVPNHINLLFFGYMLTYFPTLALTNTLAMRNMTDPEKEFPKIRVWGTIGWIAAGLVLTQVGWEKTVSMFHLTACAAIILGIFSFLLPDTPADKGTKVTLREILGLDALVLLKNPSYLVFIVASTLICIPLAFYYQITSRVVELVGEPIGRTMTYGQMSEILFMVVMPLFFRKLGVKWMLAVGMLAWVVRYYLFAIGAPSEIVWMIVGGIVLHGICYDFFFVTGQIYTDKVAPQKIRGQAQGMLVLFTLGLGMFVGAQVAAKIEASHTPPAAIELAAKVAGLNDQIAEAEGDAAEQLIAQRDEARHEELAALEWKPLWMKPAIFALIILVIFVVVFRNPNSKNEDKLATE